MNRYEFRAMDTAWAILADAPPPALRDAAAFVHAAEATLSRFRPDSALSRLNRERVVRDPVVAEVLAAALELSRVTAGAFDPTVGDALAEVGYDCSFTQIGVARHDAVAAPRPPLGVEIDGDFVRLVGEGTIDLGGIAKGWTVDGVARRLREAGAARVLVDGGGDIRAAGGAWPVGVGDDLSVVLTDGAVATSSTLRRRWRHTNGEHSHHIIDPTTRRSASSAIDTASVVARDAATADALATAILARPDEVLTALDMAHARVAVRADGRWWTSPTWAEDV